MELKFKGQRGRQDCVVLVSHDGGESYANLPLYLEWVNHSPTGFEWGYYGSGPSQLAYAIWHHYFAQAEGLSGEEAHEKALDIYIPFKQTVIGRVNSDSWEVDGCDLPDFIRHWEKQNKISS